MFSDNAITSETLILTLLLSYFVLKNFWETPLMVFQAFSLVGIPVQIKSSEPLLRLSPDGFNTNFYFELANRNVFTELILRGVVLLFLFMAYWLSH